MYTSTRSYNDNNYARTCTLGLIGSMLLIPGGGVQSNTKIHVDSSSLKINYDLFLLSSTIKR